MQQKQKQKLVELLELLNPATARFTAAEVIITVPPPNAQCDEMSSTRECGQREIASDPDEQFIGCFSKDKGGDRDTAGFAVL